MSDGVETVPRARTDGVATVPLVRTDLSTDAASLSSSVIHVEEDRSTMIDVLLELLWHPSTTSETKRAKERRQLSKNTTEQLQAMVRRPSRSARVVVECDGKLLKTAVQDWKMATGLGARCDVLVDVNIRMGRANTPTDNYIRRRLDTAVFDVADTCRDHTFRVVSAVETNSGVIYLVVLLNPSRPRPTVDLHFRQLNDIQQRFNRGEGKEIKYSTAAYSARERRIVEGPWCFTMKEGTALPTPLYLVCHNDNDHCVGDSVVKAYQAALWCGAGVERAQLDQYRVACGIL
jgi:hypothetical protein